MSLFQPVNLLRWVEENRGQLKPPVGNKMVWKDERGTIVMIVGGPNARNDYHVNVTEEFFYQIQGDITVGIIHPDTGKPEEIIIREGEIYLLPGQRPPQPAAAREHRRHGRRAAATRPAPRTSCNGIVRATTGWSMKPPSRCRTSRPT